MGPIEVRIEKDKINDFSYIQDKVLNVCLQTLFELSKNTSEDFRKLAIRFLPVDDVDKEEIINTFLSKIKDDTSETSQDISEVALIPQVSEVEDTPVIKTAVPPTKKRKIIRKHPKKKNRKNEQV